jgi:hypothetical protein
MSQKEMKQIIDVCESKLSRVYLVANMLCFEFEKEDTISSLHVQCFYRIHKNNEILVTSQDYHIFDYDKGDEDGMNNDLWKNFKKISNQIEGNLVTKMSVNEIKDINISLDNGFQIDIYVSHSKSNFEEMIEQYRFLPSGKDVAHLVVYN